MNAEVCCKRAPLQGPRGVSMQQEVGPLGAGERGEQGKRQRSSNETVFRSAGKENRGASAAAQSSMRGHKLTVFLDNVSKVEALLSLLRYCKTLSPTMEEPVIRECIHDCKKEVALGDESDCIQLSSDEALAAALVLESTVSAQPFACFAPMSLKELSTKGEYELCLSLMLQYVYGKGASVPPGPEQQGFYVRQMMLGGNFWQATQMRHLLVSFLGRIITVENCLKVLQNAGEWKETQLHQRADRFIEGLGLTELKELLDNQPIQSSQICKKVASAYLNKITGRA